MPECPESRASDIHNWREYADHVETAESTWLVERWLCACEGCGGHLADGVWVIPGRICQSCRCMWLIEERPASSMGAGSLAVRAIPGYARPPTPGTHGGWPSWGGKRHSGDG